HRNSLSLSFNLLEENVPPSATNKCVNSEYKQLGAKLFAQPAGNITLLFTTTMETSPVHLLEKYQANYQMQLLLFKMCQLRIEAAWGKAFAQSAGNITLLFTTTAETSPVHLLKNRLVTNLAGAVIETQTRHGTACLSLGHASTGSRHALPIPAPRPRIPALCDCRCCKGEGNPIRRNFPILRGYIAGSSALYFEIFFLQLRHQLSSFFYPSSAPKEGMFLVIPISKTSSGELPFPPSCGGTIKNNCGLSRTE
ncbi:hypothetical protein J6590_042462, partial [Homalodisca vitripennis]